MSAKIFPKDITSYDLLKTFAVLTMIFDHIGLYFFPEHLWIRVIGRMSFPVWLFLIGYARSRDLPMMLFVGAGALIVADMIAGIPIFMLNIIVTIIFVRIVLDRIALFCFQSYMHFWCVGILLFALSLPTAFILDYGAQAILTALFGYCIRHRKNEKIVNDRFLFSFMMFVFFNFVVVQHIMFGFSMMQFTVMIVCVGFVYLVLYYFQSKVFSGFTRKCPLPVVFVLQLCGRRSLEIYVVHLLIFKALGFYFGTIGDGLFAVHLFDL